MSRDITMYILQARGPGEKLSVRRKGGGEGDRADLGPNIQAFERGGPWDNFASSYGSIIFESVEELADYCKQKRVMLKTDAGALPRVLAVHKYYDEGQFSFTISALNSSGGDAFLWLGDDEIKRFNALLGDDRGVYRRITDWPITRAFLYIDISDFSQLSHRRQIDVANSLVRLVNNDPSWEERREFGEARGVMEALICTGDGYIYVFRDTVHATCFAANLACLVEKRFETEICPVGFHFRMGLHVGEVYNFFDPGRNDWNFIGDGINGGQGVLFAIEKTTDDVLFVSYQVRRELLKKETGMATELFAALTNKGRRMDKHGNPWRVYELDHARFMHLTS